MKTLLLVSSFSIAASLVVQNTRFDKTRLHGWLDNFLPKVDLDDTVRRRDFPEQYTATYVLSTVELKSDTAEATLLRPLLKQTMLEQRPLQVVYDAQKHGWNPDAFHRSVDGRGAALVVATKGRTIVVGGYNPKGWASTGGARPSVAAFLFYQRNPDGEFQKLKKVGGGGLACSRDDPGFGISLGPDGLVIGLQPGRQKTATSKLGPYYERGPQDLSSLFPGGSVELDSLKVLVGVYEQGEEIPYSGAVMDMTSG
jgi:TLD